MAETWPEQLYRLRIIAAGAGSNQLSANDVAAVGAVLERFEKLEATARLLIVRGPYSAFDMALKALALLDTPAPSGEAK